MKKLTKAQAEWLKREIYTKDGEMIATTDATACAQGAKFTLDKLNRILDKCTEKEFPEYSFETQRHRIMSLYHNDGVIVLNQEISLEKDELIKLVSMLQNAIEWLEEQE